MSDVTRLLDALREGDEDASDQLVRAVYGELRRLAAAKLRQERSRTLGATALVHEAWMRISTPGADGGDAPPALEFENRAHFLGAAAEAMRRILIERARRRRSLKHGGAHARDPLIEPDELIALPPEVDIVALDEALARLREHSPEKARIVDLRFFCGLSIVEAADVLGVSRATADRNWSFAKAWLFRELKGAD